MKNDPREKDSRIGGKRRAFDKKTYRLNREEREFKRSTKIWGQNEKKNRHDELKAVENAKNDANENERKNEIRQKIDANFYKIT